MTATPIDTHAVHELILFADNTERLYAMKTMYLANAKRHIKRGNYDPAKAVKLWRFWVDYAALCYRKEFGCSPATFPPAVRFAAAKDVSEREYEAILSGEYSE